MNYADIDQFLYDSLHKLTKVQQGVSYEVSLQNGLSTIFDIFKVRALSVSYNTK